MAKPEVSSAEFDAALDAIRERVLASGRSPLAILGIRRRGVPLAARLRSRLTRAGLGDIPLGELDINLYRDDIHDRGVPRVRETRIPFPLESRHVLLVDDVLHTGRTIRAALTALASFGRPRSVMLAALVDRGGRELPISADFVGLPVAAEPGELVRVLVEEEDGEDGIRIVPRAGVPR